MSRPRQREATPTRRSLCRERGRSAQNGFYSEVMRARGRRADVGYWRASPASAPIPAEKVHRKSTKQKGSACAEPFYLQSLANPGG